MKTKSDRKLSIGHRTRHNEDEIQERSNPNPRAIHFELEQNIEMKKSVKIRIQIQQHRMIAMYNVRCLEVKD